MDNGVFFKKADSGRIKLFDTLRGFMIILVIIFHAAFDIYWIFGKSFGFLHIIDSAPILFLRDFFAVGFIVLSGICTNYSRNPFRRGVIVFIFGLIITFSTALVMPKEMIVRFGILSLIGTSMILVSILRPFNEKVDSLWGITISLAAFIGMLFLFPMYVDSNHLYFLGFITVDFTSGDYYPLLPYFFAFLFGHFLGRLLKEKEFDKKYCGLDIKPLSFIGRNSVYFYILHQPIVYGVCWILFEALGL